MGFVPLMLLALSLAMDAFAVATANGISAHRVRTRDALKTGVFFGFFQGAMPVLGYLLGEAVSRYIKVLGHWVAFVVLGIIGAKMIFDSIREDASGKRERRGANRPFANRQLLVMALATSIDALAVGLTLALLEVNILQAALTIGVVTFSLSSIGVLLGRLLGCAFKRGAQIAGGVVLVLIGIRILTEHLAAVCSP